jgi:hypothetical protein
MEASKRLARDWGNFMAKESSLILVWGKWSSPSSHESSHAYFVFPLLVSLSHGGNEIGFLL